MQPITRFQTPSAAYIGRGALSLWSGPSAAYRVGGSVYQARQSAFNLQQAHRFSLPVTEHGNYPNGSVFPLLDSAVACASQRSFSAVAFKEGHNLASLLRELPPWQCGACSTINRVSRAGRNGPLRTLSLEDGFAKPDEPHAHLTDQTVQFLFFCQNCGALCRPEDAAALNLQNPATTFTLFSLGPVRLDISESVLRASYLRLQFHLHPDRITQLHRENEKEDAAHFSGFIAQCYNTLKDPLLRGSLVLRYLKSASEPKIEAGVPDPLEAAIDDEALLLEIFEYEEQIAALSDPDEARTVLRVLESELANAFQQFKDKLGRNDLASAQALLQRCRMLDNLKHKCSRWLVDNATPDTPPSATHNASINP